MSHPPFVNDVANSILIYGDPQHYYGEGFCFAQVAAPLYFCEFTSYAYPGALPDRLEPFFADPQAWATMMERVNDAIEAERTQFLGGSCLVRLLFVLCMPGPFLIWKEKVNRYSVYVREAVQSVLEEDVKRYCGGSVGGVYVPAEGNRPHGIRFILPK